MMFDHVLYLHSTLWWWTYYLVIGSEYLSMSVLVEVRQHSCVAVLSTDDLIILMNIIERKNNNLDRPQNSAHQMLNIIEFNNVIFDWI